ncbi:hypothetical protein NM688_g9394 [Phlebia brevispora]|uniref:Uncharacterized protein n=1 Tax=Phlebia brevispora TaxID=194682 RepID=A0ACC1RKE6_9APHY|nr:hypothetical protein NM688_g9394 [Phlebia brevispora]
MSTPTLAGLSSPSSEYVKENDSARVNQTRVIELELSVDPSTELDSAVWWKIDLWILPVATLIFFLSFLDRSNIGNARVAGLQKQLNMTDYQYTVALTVTYVPYILVEIPSNLLMKVILHFLVGDNNLEHLPQHVVTTMHGLITSFSGLVAGRFFLGGLLPGLALYLSSFYPRRKLQLRIAVFFASSSLAGAFSGLLASAIVHMDGVGNKPGWAWIFILEGIFTVICGVSMFFLMPETPMKAKFLTSNEKKLLIRYLREDGALSRNEIDDTFAWDQVKKAFMAPQALILAFAGFFNGATLFGLAYFLPTIVASLGYTANRAQLMSVPPFAASFVREFHPPCMPSDGVLTPLSLPSNFLRVRLVRPPRADD